jgi:hypothetical protein
MSVLIVLRSSHVGKDQSSAIILANYNKRFCEINFDKVDDIPMLKKVKNLPTSCCCALYWLVFFELTNTRLLTHIARAKAKHYYHYGKCSK